LIQVSEDLAKHTKEEKAAKAAMSEATALREKEAAAFVAQDADDKKNIAAIEKAITAIKKGQTEFLQTGEAQEVQRLVANKQDIDDVDKRDVLEFFSQQEGGPGSAAIVGILQNMLDVMSKGAEEAAAAEAASVTEYEQLKAAKDNELQALTSAIEKKTQRQGELSVKNADTENDLTDTRESLKQNENLLTQLDKECDSKEAQYEQNKKMRAEELAAIAETIKILNDDDALDLFKKTLPEGGSFLQVRVTAQMVRQRAIEAIHQAIEDSRSPHLDFITLALRGKKIGFEKILKMIDDLVSTLKKQEKDDVDKKAYCTSEFDTTEDKIKDSKRTQADVQSAMDDAKESISSLGDDRESLQNGIEDLDKSVADSTEQRKEEHAEFMDLMTSDTAAKEILQFAKNRLNKFYNPALYRPPPKKELSAQDAIVAGIAGDSSVQLFLQVRTQKQSPPPPPETISAFKKKSKASTGVIAMIDLLISDLDKEMAQHETEDKQAQQDYEAAMADSAAKRKADLANIADKKSAIADMEGQRQKYKDDKQSNDKDLRAVLDVENSLHKECDWLLKYFTVRKEARASEINALEKAKAILSGADFS